MGLGVSFLSQVSQMPFELNSDSVEWDLPAHLTSPGTDFNWDKGAELGSGRGGAEEEEEDTAAQFWVFVTSKNNLKANYRFFSG